MGKRISKSTTGAKPDRGESDKPGRPTVGGDLTISELAGLLRVSEETIADHVTRGAPVDGKGRMNVVHYVAWLNQTMNERSANVEA